MANGNGNGEQPKIISVSRETLRAELAELELRLFEKLADKNEVDALRTRLTTLEKNALTQGGPISDDLHDLDKRQSSIEAIVIGLDKELSLLKKIAEGLDKSQESQDKKIDDLKADKIGRDAIRKMWGGGIIVTILVVIQTIASIWLAQKGVHVGGK